MNSSKHVIQFVQCIVLLMLFLVSGIISPVLAFTNVYSWREFIILHHGAVVRATLSLSLNENVWTVSSPLIMTIEAVLIKKINVTINVILKLKHIIEGTVIYEEYLYLGSLNNKQRVFVKEVSIYPKTEAIRRLIAKKGSMDMTIVPEIMLVSKKGVTFSGETAPFHLVLTLDHLESVEVSYGTIQVLRNGTILDINVKTNAYWDLTKTIRPIELRIQGYGIGQNRTIELIASIKTDTTVLISKYIGSFSKKFSFKTFLSIPQDYLKDLFGTSDITTLFVEIIIIDYDGKTTIVSIPLKILCKLTRPKVNVELSVQKNVFVGQRLLVSIRIVNVDEKQQIFLETIKLLVNDTTVLEKALEEMLYRGEERTVLAYLTLNNTGNYGIKAVVKFRDNFLRLLEANSSVSIVNVLNPLVIKIEKPTARVGEKIEMIIRVGLPEIRAMLQYRLENMSTWKTLRILDLKFPGITLNIGPFNNTGKYFFRLISANNIESNIEVIEITRKTTISVFPIFLEAKPGSMVNITLTIASPPQDMQIALLKQDNRTGSWNTVPYVSLKRSGLNYVITFTIPNEHGTYRYRVELLSKKQVVAISPVIVITTISETGKKHFNEVLGLFKVGPGVLSLELFTASLSTLCLFSFILWRRFKG